MPGWPQRCGQEMGCSHWVPLGRRRPAPTEVSGWESHNQAEGGVTGQRGPAASVPEGQSLGGREPESVSGLLGLCEAPGRAARGQDTSGHWGHWLCPAGQRKWR